MTVDQVLDALKRKDVRTVHIGFFVLPNTKEYTYVFKAHKNVKNGKS